MSQTWIFSDSHFRHKNIVAYCGRPSNHEELMWQGLLSNIGQDDTLIHLGDVVLGNLFHAQEVVNKLPGKVKILIEGNHDKRGRVRRCAGWDKVVRLGDVLSLEHDGVRLALTHRPQDLVKIDPCSADICLHGHIHERGVPFRWNDKVLTVNACVEQHEYKPIPLTRIIEIYRAGPQTFLCSNVNSS